MHSQLRGNDRYSNTWQIRAANQGTRTTTVVRVPSPQKPKSQLDFEMGISEMRREKEIWQLQYQVAKQRS